MLRKTSFVVVSLLLPLGAQASDLYVANFYTSTVNRFSSTGVDLGTFCNTNGSYPQAIALDSQGNLYVTNTYDNNGQSALRKFSSTGAGLGVITAGIDAYSLAVDHNDNVYVSKGGIQRFRVDGTSLGTFFSGVAGTIRGLTFDDAGNLYIVNRGYGIRKVSPSGTQLGLFPFAAGNGSPNGLAIDGSGNIYVSDYADNAIYKLGPDGTDLGTFANTGMNHPVGIAFDLDGNLYVANDGVGYSPPAYESTVHKFGPMGQDLGTFASTGQGTGPETLAFIPVRVTGDFNHDNKVDAADYVVWRKGLGTTYTQNDYAIWRAQFGQTAGSGAGGTASAAVPEPANLMFMSLAAACGYRRRRRAA